MLVLNCIGYFSEVIALFILNSLYHAGFAEECVYLFGRLFDEVVIKHI